MLLTGRACQVFKWLPDDTRINYELANAALKNRFEPESLKTLYQMKLQPRVKQKGEGWAEFGEDLRVLADKTYPDLVCEAREQFALNQYLTQLSNPQVAFAVKQPMKTPVDNAVQATLEMESYSKPVPSVVAQVSEEVEESAGAVALTEPK